MDCLFLLPPRSSPPILPRVFPMRGVLFLPSRPSRCKFFFCFFTHRRLSRQPFAGSPKPVCWESLRGFGSFSAFYVREVFLRASIDRDLTHPFPPSKQGLTEKLGLDPLPEAPIQPKRRVFLLSKQSFYFEEHLKIFRHTPFPSLGMGLFPIQLFALCLPSPGRSNWRSQCLLAPPSAEATRFLATFLTLFSVFCSNTASAFSSLFFNSVYLRSLVAEGALMFCVILPGRRVISGTVPSFLFRFDPIHFISFPVPFFPTPGFRGPTPFASALASLLPRPPLFQNSIHPFWRRITLVAMAVAGTLAT